MRFLCVLLLVGLVVTPQPSVGSLGDNARPRLASPTSHARASWLAASQVAPDAEACQPGFRGSRPLRSGSQVLRSRVIGEGEGYRSGPMTGRVVGPPPVACHSHVSVSPVSSPHSESVGSAHIAGLTGRISPFVLLSPNMNVSAIGYAVNREVSGFATWFDAPSPQDAAAGPSLRKALGRHWRGSTVRVCSDECVVVRLTDFCACSSRHGTPTVIDLDDVAFARLAPLSAGVIKVRITVVGQIDVPLTGFPTAPPTDVAAP